MATASGLLSEDQFRCSICLDVFTDPVTTPCGHNYCNACITEHWDTSDVCQCPLCNKRFYRKPEFSVNRVLSEMVDLFRKSLQLKMTSNANQEPANPDEVSCDVCGTEAKLKAVKSCLVCLVSYCETHLEPHHRVARLKRHTLIDPVKNLEDYVCQKHDRRLELFCKTDHTCVCQFCSELDHKLHHVVSLEEEYEGKKAELGKTEAEVQQMIQERGAMIQEVRHTVELSKKDADTVIAESVEFFTALISCIERSQAELTGVIEEKQKTTEKQAEGFIKDLQQEITQLEKRSSELKLLSHTEDHIHLLQNFASINTTPPPTKDWTKVKVHQSSHVETVRTAVSQLEKTLSQEMKKKLCDADKLYPFFFSPDIKHDGGKPFFTRDPAELTGTFIFTELKKSQRGLGFSVVGGDEPHEYFLQVSDLMVDGPAALDGNMEPGDVIVCVNDTMVLGHTHGQLATILSSIPVDARVDLSLCRGYPLPFRPPGDSDCNPSTEHSDELWREYSTAPLGENPTAPRSLGSSSTAVDQRRQVASWPELVTVPLVIEKGDKGLGFTVSTNQIDGVHSVKLITYYCRGGDLKVGDVLMEVNNRCVQHMSHGQVVDLLSKCPRGSKVRLLVQRATY